MIGIDTLTAIRMRGMRPSGGVMLLLEHANRFAGQPLMAEVASGEFAQIDAEPTENFNRADLRCVVGLPVLVSGMAQHAESIRAACAACVEAGASPVVGIAHDYDQQHALEMFRHG